MEATVVASFSALRLQGLDLKHGAGQLRGLGLHGRLDAQTRQHAADDAAGEEKVRLRAVDGLGARSHGHAHQRSKFRVGEHEDAL